MARVLFILPQSDFDPTEVAVPWAALSDAGHEIVFATELGTQAACDPVTLTGTGLPFHARSLAARDANRALYEKMIATQAFANPITWQAAVPGDYALFVFPGGHAVGMKPYLESPAVQFIAIAAFAADKPVGAICHGVIPLARAKAHTGRPLLHGRKTTALTGMMERIAILTTRATLGDHYRTYPQSVEDEVKDALASPRDFRTGPLIPRYATQDHPERGFIVEDGNYVSARWPGDAWTFANRLCEMLITANPA
jgi:protease I